MSEQTLSLVPCKTERLSGREAAVLFSSLAAGLWYAYGHTFFAESLPMPGIGLTLSWMAVMAVFLTGSRKRFRPGREGILLLSVSFLLAVCGGLYAVNVLRLMNLPLIALTAAAGLGCCTGRWPGSPLSARGMKAVLSVFVPDLFRCWGKAFRLSGGRRTRQRLADGFIGLLASIPLITVILMLLLSADSAFSAFLTRRADEALRFDGTFFLRLLLGLAAGLGCFSMLQSARRREEPERIYVTAVPAAGVLPGLFCLCALYVLFIAVRLKALNGTGEGSLAGYARSGFFQLTAVSLITLTFVTLVLRWTEHKAVRSLSGLLCLLTEGLLGLAAASMIRYMEAFGLSLLRALTIWGMVMIFLAALAVLTRCLRPGFRSWKKLAVLALVSWTALNLSCPARWIAGFNVDRFNRFPAVMTLDHRYLVKLSPAVLPAIRGIADPSVRTEALRFAQEWLSENRPSLYDWSVDWLLSGLSGEAGQTAGGQTGAGQAP